MSHHKGRSHPDRRLHLLSEFAEVAASSLKEDELLRRFVRWMVHALPAAEGFAVYFHDKKSDKLAPVAWHGLKVKPFRKVRLSPGEGITGLAFQNRIRFLIENPEDPVTMHLFGEGLSYENAQYLEAAQGCVLPRTIVSYPLQHRCDEEGKPFGVLSAWSHARPLDPESLELLEAVIPPLTVALFRVNRHPLGLTEGGVLQNGSMAAPRFGREEPSTGSAALKNA